jgi:hypothetical protein
LGGKGGMGGAIGWRGRVRRDSVMGVGCGDTEIGCVCGCGQNP